MIELNQIIHADCMDIMKDIPDKYFELAIVDPPYGININSNWDKLEDRPTQEYFKELFRISEKQIIFGGNYFQLPITQGWICWDKKFAEDIKGGRLSTSKIKAENISDFELLWTSFLNKSKFCRYTNLGNLKGFDNNLDVDYEQPVKMHITQKPVALYKWLLKNYAKQGDKILDTHGGSCSSVVACIDYGFEYLAIEKDKDYFDASVKRINKELLKIKMF